ncbi:hypothetical protein [Solimonas sp. K1W22B-7]|uniref:hypothetical protein n=1 Tax=Solimonas sp. K1W22B-7 TaxID=2303331 RepID=UPI00196949A1|nr:hypothetical protein [Solimonas sp. K1W22B-7]
MVLGNLLIQGIAAYKSYTNMAGYDIVATKPETNRSARIQVKSRWRTGAEGFIINNFNTDFVVVVLLNRGSKSGTGKVLPPEFYVFPVAALQGVPRSEKWGKVSLSKIVDFGLAKDRWDSITEFLGQAEAQQVLQADAAAPRGLS